MEEPVIVEHFFGVYILYSMNEKYKGRTYIGYTVNPNRRLKQHNAGAKFGGAHKTSKRGPWKMILIVHGFPSSTSALMFEWAWQHPASSRRLKHVKRRKSRQKLFDYCLDVLTAMLNVGPWCRLPLTVRFFDDDFYSQYRSIISPPLHMPITHGPIIPKKLGSQLKKKQKKKKKDKKIQIERNDISLDETNEFHQTPMKHNCHLCCLPIIDIGDKITCVQQGCSLVAHIICLGKLFSKNDGMLLPINGICPVCGTDVLWGDLIRKMIGCNLHLTDDPELIESAAKSLIILSDDDSDFEK